MKWALIAGVIIARASDVAITYHITPDFEAEQNVLAVWGGAGWSFLLAVNAIVIAITAWLILWAAKLRPQLFPREPDLSRKEFAAHYYFGPGREFRDMMWHFPTGKHNVMVFGALLPSVLICISLVVGASHAAALTWQEYAVMHNAVVTRLWAQFLVAWAVAGGSTHLAWRLEYSIYLRQQ